VPNALYEAIFRKDLQAVKQAVEIEKIDVNQLDPAIGLPPLAIAVREGQFDIFCYLIAQKADPNNVGSKNVPPINFIAAIDDKALKKRFITEFLKIPTLQISAVKRQSLEVIIGTLKLEEINLPNKTDLTNLGGYLFYFNALKKGELL
jgi:ankyrin repeat protein